MMRQNISWHQYGILNSNFTETDWNWYHNHDDVIKWKHFPRNWSFVRGIHRSPVNSSNFNRNTKLFIHKNVFEKSSAKWRPFCPGGDELSCISPVVCITYCVLYIIALWGWFCRDALLVTCCEHGPPSIATVHFSKFSIAPIILFN